MIAAIIITALLFVPYFFAARTGVFRFPNRRAAEIALDTMKQFWKGTNSGIEVVFNVFKEYDREIYRELLGAD